MEQLIYFYYIFFQGTLFLQFAIFISLYRTSAKKELLYYSLFLLLIGINFLISDPSTFGLGNDDMVLNSSWYKLVNTPLVITANIFYVLFLREFYHSLTSNKLFFLILKVTKKVLLAALALFLILFACGIHSNLFFNILNFLGTLTGIWLVIIIIREKMPFTRLMAYGFIINLVGTLLTVWMLILLTQGVKHLLVSEYPFVFVKAGILAEIFFFNLAIFKKWHWQEKELAVLQLQTELAVGKVRSQISMELHDDIGSTLSGINMYSHMAKQQSQSGQNNESEKSLDIILNASDEMIYRLKDMVWVIQPGHDTIEQLLGKIKEYAIFITGAKNINLHIHFSDNDQSIKVSTVARHHIYTIAKEILNNAVKYSGATDIIITAVTNSYNLIFKIEDNGKGFDTIHPTDGNGLTNIRTKAAELAGILEINSLPGKGSVILLKLKITQRGIV